MANFYHPTIASVKQKRAALMAQLVGSSTVIVRALGVTSCGDSPVLELCRNLVAAGLDPATPLEVYRAGGVLALQVRSIGEAAELEINPRGYGFVRRHERRRAPPTRGDAPGSLLPPFEDVRAGAAARPNRGTAIGHSNASNGSAR
jgi:hypothetical protein